MSQPRFRKFRCDGLLSSEDFETALVSPELLSPLLNHRLLSEQTFTLVCYVREQASYLESLFFEMLNHGMAVEASRFFAKWSWNMGGSSMRIGVSASITTPCIIVNGRQALSRALALFLQLRGRGVELPEILAEFPKYRCSHLSPQIRSALADRFAGATAVCRRYTVFVEKLWIYPPRCLLTRLPLKNCSHCKP